jgi:hypothetical protein
MNRIRSIRAALATLASTLLALAAAPAAFASPLPRPVPPVPPYGGTSGTQSTVRVIVTGGMPGWQITLIAVGAALVAAAIAVLADRGWTTRKSHAATTA